MVNNDFDEQFDAAGKYYNVNPQLIKAIFHQESGGDPTVKKGPAGELGPMQIMPKTAAYLHLDDPNDMTQAIPAAAKYLREGLDANNNDPVAAVRYYNGGPNGVNNPQTLNYAKNVANLYPQMALKTTTAPAAENNSSGKSSGAKERASVPKEDNSLGEDIYNGKSPVAETPASAPAAEDNSLGESLYNSSGSPEAVQKQQAAQDAIPSVLTTLGAGVVHGISDPILGAGQFVANHVGLTGLGQNIQDIRNNTDTQLKDKGISDTGTYQGANVAGQIIGTLPAGGVIGKLGVGLTSKAAQFATSPAVKSIIHGAGDIITGGAQGGEAAAQTGGDPIKGALGGSLIGSAGVALGAGTDVLTGLGAKSKAIGDYLIDKISRLATYKLGGGDITGWLLQHNLAPMIKSITEKYGEEVGHYVARGFNSTEASTAGGVIAGKMGSLGQQPQDIPTMIIRPSSKNQN